MLRPASTLVLARGTSGPPELLFVERPKEMKAFGGFHAFPGGSLDPEDASDLAAQLSTLSADEASERLGEDAGDDPPLAFFVCAVRELFEEVGVLLAVDGEGRFVPERADEVKARLDRGAGFFEAVGSAELSLATDRLGFLVRWVAPEGIPVRFDVRVFVTQAAGDPVPDPREVAHIDWYDTSTALALSETGKLLLAPPTVGTIASLSPYGSVEELLSGRAQRPENPIERHSPMVRRLVAPNPSLMTGPGTNTYVVGEERLVVIDPGILEHRHLERLAGLGEIDTVVITHHHIDHVGGALDLANMVGAEVAASARFWARAKTFHDGRALEDGESLVVPGATLEVIDTPGHASDHICLWLEEERALFSADLVLGEGTSVISPPDGSLVDYLTSLRRVRALEPRKLYPGHFDPRDDAVEWIDYYIAHRHEREEQVIAALEKGKATVDQIVAAVYSSYPEALHPVAERSVLAHLEKLIDERRVSAKEDRFTFTG